MTSVKHYFYALRPQQWIKNFFVFLPLIFSNQLTEPHAALISTAAFLCFCAVASGSYILNDLIDLNADKIHPTKRLRPLAAGKISPNRTFVLAIILLISSVTFSFYLKTQFGWIILSYLILNTAYSLRLKEMVIVDVMCIGAFFVLRAIGGAIVLNIEISHWLVICTAVLALFIGFNKRRHELKLMGMSSPRHRKVLEHYNLYFIDQMIAVLTASTVVFYTLYTVDQRTINFFGSSSLIYTVPFVYYGIFRYLYLVHKVGKGGDPTRIVLSDNKLAVNIFLWLAATMTIIYFNL